MAFTVTPPTQPEVHGTEKREYHIVSGGGGAETALPAAGAISAKFLRRILRTEVHDMEIVARVITPAVGNAAPTASFTVEAGPTEGVVVLIGD